MNKQCEIPATANKQINKQTSTELTKCKDILIYSLEKKYFNEIVQILYACSFAH